MAATIELSEEQKEVIDSRNARIQVIACAGSGKTETMARRIVRLLAGDAPPQGIVAFTFTERAAAGLKTRVLQRVAAAQGEAASRRLGPMFIGTIHGYCFRLLQQHAPHFGSFDVLDEHRLAALLSREHGRLKLGELGDGHWAPIQDFLRNVQAVENELIPPAKLPEPFRSVYRVFSQRLERYRLLTYGSIITRAIELLENPAASAAIRQPLRHLIVDEYQDVNPAQERLIALLAAPPAALCVVGDDDQAIYQWRGSDVANMTGFAGRHPGCARPSLSVNRRSTRSIIAAANRSVQPVKPRLAKSMRPRDDAAEGLAPVFWVADTAAKEAANIADHIVCLHQAGYFHSEIAVLFRSVRTSAPPLVEALTQRGVPYRCGGRTGLFLQPEARLLGRTYAWLAGNTWKDDRFGKVSETVTLDTLVPQFSKCFDLDSEATRRLRTRLTGWRKAAGENRAPANLVGDYYRLLSLLGVASWNLDQAGLASRAGVLARFSQLLADFEHVKRRARYEHEDGQDVYRGGEAGGPWFYRQLHNYIQHYALDAYEDFVGEELSQDAVEILTVHQAKGLEWPVVFVPALKIGRFPSSKTGQKQKWLAPLGDAQRQRYEGTVTDERRLFYVALTRAREALYLSYFRRTEKQRANPSPFFSELAGPKTAQAQAPPPLPPPAARPAPQGEAAEFSFSELAQYLDCPKAYRLRTSLGFEPQLARELGYGRAVHAVLRELAETARKTGRVPTASEAEAILDREFYLPYANAAALPPMKAAARTLIEAYRLRFGEDLRRTWDTERPFELAVEGARIQGRADVILDRERGEPGALALLDYKTVAEDWDLHFFQLAVYAAAACDEGLNVRAAYLHDLGAGADAANPGGEVRRPAPVNPVDLKAARRRAAGLAEQIAGRQFAAKPGKKQCGRCDVHMICRDSAAGQG